MKVRLDVDATPEELRRFFGLPDVSPLNEEVVDTLRRRMHEGAEGYDPAALLAPFAQGTPALETLQRLFWGAAPGTRRGQDEDGDDGGTKGD